MSEPMSHENKGPIARFLAAPPDSVGKTLFVAISVCLVASMIVSTAAVSLRPTQEANKLRDKQVNILQVAGLYDPANDVTEAFAAFEPQVLDLDSGEFTDAFDAATFDDLAAADDPELSRALEDDPARSAVRPASAPSICCATAPARWTR